MKIVRKITDLRGTSVDAGLRSIGLRRVGRGKGFPQGGQLYLGRDEASVWLCTAGGGFGSAADTFDFLEEIDEELRGRHLWKCPDCGGMEHRTPFEKDSRGWHIVTCGNGHTRTVPPGAQPGVDFE